jgi:hypothetical protein
MGGESSNKLVVEDFEVESRIILELERPRLRRAL